MPYLSNINLLIPIFVIIQKLKFFAVVYFNGLYQSSKKAFVNVIINPQFLTIVSHNPLVNVRAHTNYKFITLVGVVNLLFFSELCFVLVYNTWKYDEVSYIGRGYGSYYINVKTSITHSIQKV